MKNLAYSQNRKSFFFVVFQNPIFMWRNIWELNLQKILNKTYKSHTRLTAPQKKSEIMEILSNGRLSTMFPPTITIGDLPNEKQQKSKKPFEEKLPFSIVHEKNVYKNKCRAILNMAEGFFFWLLFFLSCGFLPLFVRLFPILVFNRSNKSREKRKNKTRSWTDTIISGTLSSSWPRL